MAGVGPDDAEPDLSPLGARSVEATGLERTIWAYTNTDQMVLLDHDPAPAVDPTPVRIAGQPAIGEDYIADVGSGFREMYGTLSRNVGLLLDDRVLLSLLDEVVPRVLVRNTATYSRLQHHLLHPGFLRDGRDRSIELEWLAKPLSAASLADERMLAVHRQELSDMEQLDVPYFDAVGVPNGTCASDQAEFAEAFLRRRDATAFTTILGRLD